MTQSFNTLESLYSYLKPADTSTPKSQSSVTVKTIFDVIKEVMLDPRGKYYDWETLQAKINEYLSKPSNTESSAVKNQTGKKLHIIGSDKYIDLGDADYWGKVTNVTNICPDIKADSPVKVTLFVTRSPVLSPSTRGVEDIDFFLNYMPPVMSSQMTPYLDVSLEFLGPPIDAEQSANVPVDTSTPSMMRFLLGTTSTGNSSDAVLISGDQWVAGTDDPKKSQKHSFSGMEMFLMPQTLSNMDGLGESVPGGGARLVPVKPFLPFASIEGFDITVANAGAGSFSHKKGMLKLKVHDKARLGEFAEFIRGGGTSSSLVWTTYGWLAPVGRTKGGAETPEDAYADFINSHMLVRECWQPVNTQFTFDASGQVSFTIELVTKGTRRAQEMTLDSARANSLKSSFSQLNTIMEQIAKIKEKIDNSPRFSISMNQQQVLNAAASAGNYADLKDVPDVGAAINGLYDILVKGKGSGVVSEDEAKKLKDALNKLKTSKNDSAGAPTPEGIMRSAAADVEGIVNKIGSTGDDPFLLSRPNPKTKDHEEPTAFGKKQAFFPKAAAEEMSALIRKAVDASENYAKKSQEAATKSKGIKPIKVDRANSVVSFGKLFTSMVAASFSNSGVGRDRVCDELQVYFYGLNDQCGPASNISIAEFPIDMVALAYAYAEELKSMRTDVLTIEQFLKLVIDTQFTDVRSIAYDMRNLYDAPNPSATEPKKKDSKTYDSDMSKWFTKWGAWKPPMIEMTIETGDTTMKSIDREVISTLKKSPRYIASLDSATGDGTKKIVTRIHIYDKQNNPMKFMENIIRSGDQLLIGVDESSIDSHNADEVKSLGPDLAKLINDSMKKNPSPSKPDKPDSSLEEKNKELTSYAYSIPLDRKVFKAELMKTVPKIVIGSNGTLVTNASVASKTDGLMAAINIMRAAGKADEAKSSVSNNSLEDPGHLPLRTNPVNISITSMGVPTANLYQTFFIDFDTGTSIDNVYLCTQLQHGISQGKFQTSWTFVPSSDGYGKFANPPALSQVFNDRFKAKLDEYVISVKSKKK